MILQTIEELPSVVLLDGAWSSARSRTGSGREPGTRTYGVPSVLVQLAAQVELLRPVDRAVFTPRPRVDSALIGIRRTGPAAPPAVRRLVADAFAHRRKSLARSVSLAAPRADRSAVREAVREALRELGVRSDARAEALSPQDFERLAGTLHAA